MERGRGGVDVTIEQENEAAKVRMRAIVDRYLAELQIHEESQLDSYLSDYESKLEQLLKQYRSLGTDTAEKRVLDMVERQLTGITPDVSQLTSTTSSEVNIFLRALRALDEKVSELRQKIDEDVENFKKNEAEIFELTKKLAKMARKILEKPIYDLLPEIMGRINVEEVKEACLNVLHASTAVISSYKTVIKAEKMLKFRHWLKEELIKHALICDEIERYNNLKADLKLSEFKFQESDLANYDNIIAPGGKIKEVAAHDVTLDVYRRQMEEMLAFSEEFRALNENQQKKLLLDLELRHLLRLRDRYQADIEARLHVEMMGKNEAKRVVIKRLIESHYHGNDDEKIRLYNIVDKPDLAKGIKRNEEIKANLSYLAAQKRKKMLARAFILIGVGFALAYVIATIVAAPPLALALLGAGVVAGLIIAKTINTEDSIENIAKKGFSYFANKIRGVSTDQDKIKQKHTLASSEQHETMQDRMKRAATKRLFDRYKDMIRQDDIAETAQEDARKLCELKKISSEAAEQLVEKRLDHSAAELLTDSPQISGSKRYTPTAELVRHLQQLERRVSDAYDFLPMGKINSTASEFASYAATLMGNTSLQTAANVFGKTSLVKFKKQCMRTINLALYVTSSCIKSVRSKKMLKYDYWLKRQLVDRFQMQQEIKNLDNFDKQHLVAAGSIDEANIEARYHLLFPHMTDSEVRTMNQLSLTKFRLKLEEKLVNDQNFLTMSELEQLAIIARFEKLHMQKCLAQCEEDMVIRSRVEVSRNPLSEQLIKNINTNYLAYDSADKGSFKSRLLSMMCKPEFKNNEDKERCFNHDKMITDELKVKLNARRKNVVARTFLLIFAGLTLAALIASFALAPPAVIAGLLVGALAAAIVAKVVNKDESVKDIVSKGMRNISDKVRKQFMLWHVKEEMKVEREEQVARVRSLHPGSGRSPE